MKFIAIAGGGSVLFVNLDAIATMRFEVDRTGTSTSAVLMSVGGQSTNLERAHRRRS